MSLRIKSNTSALNAHRNLQINQQNLSKTLERLSSGLKVNRASDGPAKLVISEQMRAQIAGLSQAIDNSETAISLVQTTEANLSEISSMLTGVRQLAIHAANEGVNDEVMLMADQNEIRNTLDTINRISKQASFGNKRLLDGSNGASGFTTGNNLEFVTASLGTADSSVNGFDVKITQAATQSNITGSTALTQEMVSAGETLTVIENGKMATYTATEDDTVDTMIQNLRNEIARNGLDIDIESDGGRISAYHRKYGSDYSFQVSSSTAGVLSKEADQIESTQKGLDVKGTINGESAIGKGQLLTGVKGAKCVEGLSVRYYGGSREAQDRSCVVNDKFVEVNAKEDAEPQEIPEGGISIGRVFVSQKSLKFQVGANQDQTVGISLPSTNAETLGKGIENISGFRSLNDIDVTTFQGATDALEIVDRAINEVTSVRGKLGAFQKNTLESNLSNLRVANENLISSESVIRDVDMASEMAEYTKRQIMSQAAVAMLAQANQQPNSVLRLLN